MRALSAHACEECRKTYVRYFGDVAISVIRVENGIGSVADRFVLQPYAVPEDVVSVGRENAPRALRCSVSADRYAGRYSDRRAGKVVVGEIERFAAGIEAGSVIGRPADHIGARPDAAGRGERRQEPLFLHVFPAVGIRAAEYGKEPASLFRRRKGPTSVPCVRP